MATKTFVMIDRKGKPLGEPVEYHPIRVTIAGQQREFALHKSVASWVVSDPRSGGKVLEVYGTYRGIRVSSSGLTFGQIKSLARDQVTLLAARIGHDKFAARLDDAAKQFAPQP